MKSFELFFFIICIFVFPKYSFYFVPDFFCIYILLKYSKQVVFHNDLLKYIFAAIFLLATITFLGQIYYGVGKSFWAYHLLRIPIYYFAAITLLRVSQANKETLLKYMLVVLLVSLSGSWIELYFPEYFPKFFYDLKVESFLDAGGLKQVAYDFDSSYRSSGFYTNFQEVGFVSVIGFLISLYCLVDRKNGNLMFLLSLLVFMESIFGIIASGTRSAFIGVVISMIVFYVMSFLVFKNKKKFVYMTVFALLMSIILFFIISVLLEDEGLKSRLILLSGALLLLQGEAPSSLAKSFDQIIFPNDVWVMLFGNGIQPWTTFGVPSDVGYIQLLWGMGIPGLIVFLLFYYLCITKNLVVLKRTQDFFYVIPFALFIYVVIYGIKGNYFIGIHGGGDIVAFFIAIVMGYKMISRQQFFRKPTK